MKPAVSISGDISILDENFVILFINIATRRNKHLSIVTYSSAVWQLKDSAIKILEATEMDFWRRAGHTITEEIMTKQLRWCGHFQRMKEHRLPKQIRTWSLAERRKRGRPRKSEREGIDKEIRERGLDENLWTYRVQWRLGNLLKSPNMQTKYFYES